MKPIVYYSGHPCFVSVNDRVVARVYGLDHPVLGEGDIRTSSIQYFFEDGSFETKNTVYVPESNRHAQA